MKAGFQHRVELAALRCVAAVFRLLPEAAWYPIGRGLGTLGYWLLASRRRVSLGNLKASLPGLSVSEARRLTRLSFQRTAFTFIEVLANTIAPRALPQRRAEIRGIELLEKAVAEGCGVVCVVPHLGNWELLGAITAQLGFRHLTVAKRLKNPAVTEWIGRMREEAGMEVAWVDQDVTMRLMERLEQKGIVSMVTDQDARSRGVKVQFLGQEASAHRGAALLALSGGSPIVVGTIVRTVDGRHHEIEYTRVQPPEPTGNLEADVVALTQAYTDILTAKILEHPADYLWAHDRFKRTRQQT